VAKTPPEHEAPWNLALRWIRSGHDGPDGADTVIGYDIEHLDGEEWRLVATLPATGQDEYGARIPPVAQGADPGGTDRYRVVARTSGQQSFASRSVTWTPSSFWLGPSFPNPAQTSATILYDVPSSGGQVDLRIYDLRGRLVRTLVRGRQTPGRKRVEWTGQDESGHHVASGVYFYEMVAEGTRQARRLTLVD
jgi:hypothetical protein